LTLYYANLKTVQTFLSSEQVTSYLGRNFTHTKDTYQPAPFPMVHKHFTVKQYSRWRHITSIQPKTTILGIFSRAQCPQLHQSEMERHHSPADY
ncbi:15717_t:CDS:1, partial [Acaulospora morrowiae]